VFEFLIFKIENFQTTLDKEMTKTKVVVLIDIYNFAAEIFFIGIRLGSQILILKFGKVNTRRIFVPFSHK
jgi:hypothetical protein